jgi:hypothetical protein
MDVCIVIAVAFFGYLFSCFNGWRRFKDPEDLTQRWSGARDTGTGSGRIAAH